MVQNGDSSDSYPLFPLQERSPNGLLGHAIPKPNQARFGGTQLDAQVGQGHVYANDDVVSGSSLVKCAMLMTRYL